MKRNILWLIPAVALLIQCTTSEDGDPQPAGPITILSPAKGASVGVADTVVIITRTDYTKFSGGIHITYSFDSSKTWTAVRSIGPKGMLKDDTVKWFPVDEAADPVVAGVKALIKVTDYSKVISAQTDFTFTP